MPYVYVERCGVTIPVGLVKWIVYINPKSKVPEPRRRVYGVEETPCVLSAGDYWA